MKRRFQKSSICISILICALLFCSMDFAYSQCLPRGNFYYGQVNPGCNTFTTVTNIGPGEYFRVPVSNGVSYTISTCGTGWDSQLTGFQGTNTGVSIFYNDDFGPDCSSTEASVTFTATFTDFTRVRLNNFNCASNSGLGSATLKVRENLIGAPTIVAASSNPCSDTLVVVSPAPGYEYYWQSAINGTNTANQGTTFVPTVAGTYYVRPRSPIINIASAGNTGGCWSPASNGIAVTVGSSSSPPTTASISEDTVCIGGGTVQLIASGGVKGSGAVTEWYLGSCGGTPVGTGDTISVSPPGAAGSYNYFARYEGTCNQTSCASVGLIVENDPAITVIGPASVCIGGSASLVANLTGGAGNCAYQWQRASSPGGPWTNVGVNSQNLSTAAINATTYFRCQITCSGTNCDNAVSNVLTIGVSAQPSIAIGASSNTICAGDSVNITSAVASGLGICSIELQSAPAGSGPWSSLGTVTAIHNTGPINSNTFYRAIYSCTGAGCDPDTSNTVSVTTDGTLPMITCPANISVGSDSGLCGAIVNYTPPVGTDNCPGAVTIQTSGLASGSLFPTGITVNTFKVTDSNGDTAVCSFTVNVVDSSAVSISCPGDIVTISDSGVCGSVITYSSPVASGACSPPIVNQIAGLASGSLFPPGATVNTFIALDTAGNTDTCSFTVTVSDTSTPSITCPPNDTVYVLAGNCNAVATYTPPVVSIPCGSSNLTQIAGLASGASYPFGVTTNTYVASNGFGFNDTCSFTITVLDTIKPIIACPANISAPADSGSCNGTVTYPTPLATDNCGFVSINLVSGLASGSSFPPGISTVVYAATDTSGNSDTCSFTITISDTVRPVISCPSNVVLTTALSQCDSSYTYSVTASDNCPGVTVNQIAGLTSGSAFPAGITTNTFVAIDSAGNSDTCSFTVTVNDNQDPVISCIANINASTDSGVCGATIIFSSPLASDNCPGVTLAQISGLPSGSLFPVGVTTNSFVATDSSGNTDTCSFTVSVTDTNSLTINCPANVTAYTGAGTCNSTVTYSSPTATVTCGSASITQIAGLPSGSSFPFGVTTNTFIATDTFGNADTCSFTVTVLDTISPTVTCPGDLTVSADTGGCTAIVNYAAVTTNDNCGVVNINQIAGLASGSTFPAGSTVNTFIATDSSGNTDTCSFTVTVIDSIAPVNNCPANVSLPAAAGSCDTTYLFNVTATDNCLGANVSQIAGLTSGSSFPIGTTTNIFVATDSSGNSDTCSFTITVTDNQDPVVSCPSNINVNADSGVCGATVSFALPNASDNCPGVVLNQILGLPSGSIFPVGVTTNTFVAIDSAGNSDTCSFTVSVVDTSSISITCPANILAFTSSSSCQTTVNYSTPVVSVSCGLVSVNQISGITSGSMFPLGITTNIFVASDTSGNTDTCSFTVTVSDTVSPNILCPPNLTVNTDSGACSAVVNYVSPIATDSCGIASISQISGLASGALFPGGITTNTFVAVDSSGNTDTCSFTITVVDSINPVISCPMNITLPAAPGQCDTAYIYSVTATDNCIGAGITQIAGIASGSPFPIGVTTNTFVATDSSGNTDTCSFTVTVGFAASNIYTWTGALNSQWSNNQNWIPCGKPGLGDSAIIPAAGNNPISSSNDSIGTLIVQAGGNLTISDSFFVASTLNNSGTLNHTGANVIQIGGDFNNAGTFLTGAPVVFTGSGQQNLSGNFTGTNALGTVLILNPDSLVLGDDVQLNLLILAGGLLDLNGNELEIMNNSPASINLISGYIVGEDEASKITWQIGTATGSFVFPFGTHGGLNYIPVTFNVSAAGTGTGEISICTYPTNSQNLPYPTGVLNMHLQNNGADQSAGAANRFWRVEPGSYATNPTSDVTFRYTTSDLLVGAVTLDQNAFEAYRWNGASWDSPISGIINSGQNSFTLSGISQFSPWVLAGSCEAKFQADTVCLGNPTTFIDSSSATFYAWDFDTTDGLINSTIAANVQYTFSSPGIHPVRLVIGNVSGCVDTFVMNVLVDSSAVADFSASTECFRDSTSFADLSIGASSTFVYDWDFDNDGTYEITSASPGDVKYLYPAAGSYNAKLRITSASACSDSIIVSVVVDSVPATPTAVNDTICLGSNASLLATSGGANGDFYWYSDAGLTNLAFIGNPFNITSPPNSTSYWLVEQTGNGCSSDTARADIVVSTSLISAPSVSGDTVCIGEVAMLTSANSGTIYWYSDAALNNLAFVGNPFNVNGLITNTSYWATVVDSSGCLGDTARADVIVNTISTPTVGSDTICAGQQATVSAITGGSNRSMHWYSDAALTNLQYIGNPLVIPSGTIFSNYTGYVVEVSGVCTSDTASFNIVVQTTGAVAPMVIGDSTCIGGTASVSAMAAGSISWYSDPGLNTLVGTGSIYNTGTLLSDTSYWAIQIDSSGCPSDTSRADVVVSAIPNPTVSSDTICAGDQATLIATSGGFGGDFYWYADPSLSTVGFIGNPLYVPANTIFTSTSGWLVESDGVCESDTVGFTIVVDNSVIAAPTVTGDSICPGDQATLTATASGVVSWYSDPGLSNLVKVGSVLNTGPLSSSTSYWAVQSDSTSCFGDTARADVFVDSIASPTASADTVCSGNNATITAVSGGANGNMNWYSDAGLTNLISVGNPLILSNLTVSTTVWLVETNGNCSSDTVSVTAVVSTNVLPAPVVSNDTVCPGDQAVLTATGTGIVSWYADPATTNLVQTGSVFTTPPVNANSSYWAVQSDSSGCPGDTARADVFVQSISAPTVINDTICGGEAAVVFAVSGGANGDIYWYADSTLQNLVSIGNPLILNSNLIYASVDFYAVEVLGSCQSSVVKGSIIVESQTLPTPVVSNDTICPGDNATLIAQSAGTFEWYNDPGLTSLAFVGNPFNTTALSTATSYWVIQTDSVGCNSDTARADIIIDSLASPTVIDDTICPGAGAVVIAQSNGPNGAMHWYSDPGLNNLLSIGNPLILPSGITSSFGGWVVERSGNCASDTVPFNVVVQAIPDPIATNDSICPGDFGVLSATSGGANGQMYWYTDSTLLNLAFVGNPFNTPIVLLTTDFYVVEQDSTGCRSNTVTATVVVKANPNPTVSNDTICPGDQATLTASSTIAVPGTMNWYSDPGLTNLAFSGNPFITPQTFVSTDYWLVETAGNCPSDTVRASVVVIPLPLPSVTNDTICEGEVAELTATTGGANGNFYWFSAPDINNLVYIGNPFLVSGLTSDTVFWVVENDGACVSDTIRANVKVNPQPIGQFQISQACFGDSTVFTDQSTGIEAGASYQIDYENDGSIDASLPAGNFSYLAPTAGPFEVRVILSNPSGCTDTFIQSYYVDSVPVVLFSADTVCEGEPTTFTDLSFFVSPGANYLWDFDGDGNIESFTSGSQQFTYPTGGTYVASLLIRNVTGCFATGSDSVFVIAKPAAASLTSNSPLCEGDTILIDATASGSGTTTFAWTGPNGFTSTTMDIEIPDVTEADHQGTYTLVITDSNGCESDPSSTYIEISPIPQTPQAGNDGPVCEGDAVQLFAGNVLNATYVWAGPNSFSSTNQNPIIDPVAITDSGIYTVYAEVNSCQSELGETRLIVKPAPTIVAIGDTSIEEGTIVQTSASGGIAYIWDPPEYFSSYDISNPFVSGLPVGTNTLVVTGYNEFLCADRDTVIIEVTQAAGPNVYDVITPNGDGRNDFWVIEFPTGTVDYTISVYDRTGNRLFFNQNAYNNDWSGTRDGKELPEGAYWYIIEVDGNVFKGGITIIR